jgi:transposase-like protein
MSQESKYRKFSKEFRESALRRLALTPNVAELCRELGISRQLLYFWRDGKRREEEKRSEGAEQRLRQALLKRTLEVDFLKAACEKVEAQRQTATGTGETASGKSSGN